MRRSPVSRYAWQVFTALSLATLLGVSHKAAAQSASSPFTTGYRYNATGRVTGEIKPSAQSGQGNGFVATRNTYDASGRLVNVETGYLSSWQSEAVAPATWSGFTVVKSVISTYDVKDRKIAEVVVASDRSVAAVQQFSYDGLDRVVCTVARMNKAAFPTVTAANTLSGGSLPTDACSQGSAGDAGPDRITRNVYDTANQLVQIRRAVGTSLEQAYATYSYSPNGKQVDVIDANGNRAQFIYDGFDRQTGWYFPSTSKPTNYSASAAATSTTTTNCAGQSIAVSTASSFGSAGSVNCADYEAYGYDANGNRTSLRKRDGSILTYSFDALNRVIKKIVPERSGLAATNTRDVYYGYDLQGHQLYARFDSASGEGIVNAWDGFGRQVSSTQAIDGVTRALGYQYDADSNRTRVTFPDGNYVSYGYDGLDRPLLIQRNGSATLASYSYDSAGRRVSFTNGIGGAIATSYGYDGASRLSSLTNTPQTSAYSSQYTFGYNPASQITSLTRSNNAFVFTGTYNVNRSYTANGLNQYTAAGSAGFTYDANGNLTSDGTNSYTYDVENRLVTVSGSATATLRYDPLGRLYEVIGSTGTTRFVNDGDALVAEYNTANVLLRRYAHGADITADDPIAWYEGSDFSAATERMLRPDWQGSIVLTTDSAGTNPIAINTYDEYGIPGSNNKGRFQYTGQAWLSEVGMYYYKARIYSPTLGRFLQTDPIGYQSHLNIYGYATNDPVNQIDPMGLYSVKDEDKNTVGKYVAQLRRAAGEQVTGTRLGNTQLKRIASYIGSDNGKGPNISLSPLDSGTAGKTYANGDIKLDPNQIKSDIQGGGVLTHEGSHSMLRDTFSTSGIDESSPKYARQVYLNEFTAYLAEASYYKALDVSDTRVNPIYSARSGAISLPNVKVGALNSCYQDIGIKNDSMLSCGNASDMGQ